MKHIKEKRTDLHENETRIRVEISEADFTRGSEGGTKSTYEENGF